MALKRKAPSRLELFVRGGACVLGGLLGFFCGQWLLDQHAFSEPINLVYLTFVGLLLGYLLSGSLVGVSERLFEWTRRLPPDAVLAAGVGTTAALILSVLLNSALERIPGFSWQLSLLMTVLLVGGASWFFVSNRQLFIRAPLEGDRVRLRRSEEALTVLDTSALIDGRVVAVVQANFLTGRLLLPDVVVYELQHIADSSDAARRRRGRRGLEVVSQLEKAGAATLELVHDTPEGEAVDTKLTKLCLEREARLLTTDYNLAQVAAIAGITVLNLNELASALRPSFATGEVLNLQIAKTGREAGQGLAYLDDGTMVVVEGAAPFVGQKITAAVTSHLQTSVGRMVFAQLEA